MHLKEQILNVVNNNYKIFYFTEDDFEDYPISEYDPGVFLLLFELLFLINNLFTEFHMAQGIKALVEVIQGFDRK